MDNHTGHGPTHCQRVLGSTKERGRAVTAHVRRVDRIGRGRCQSRVSGVGSCG